MEEHVNTLQVSTLMANGSFPYAHHLKSVFSAPMRAKVPDDATGIYRYLFNGDIVYIGRGAIRSRLASNERSDWMFDKVEFSPLENQAEQERWESEWLEEYRSLNGFLPMYNRIGGRGTK
jgi:hypothetical protein